MGEKPQLGTAKIAKKGRLLTKPNINPYRIGSPDNLKNGMQRETRPKSSVPIDDGPSFPTTQLIIPEDKGERIGSQNRGFTNSTRWIVLTLQANDKPDSQSQRNLAKKVLKICS